MYSVHRGCKIYEVAYPVGENAAYFLFLDEGRHYFRSRLAAVAYLDKILDAGKHASG